MDVSVCCIVCARQYLSFASGDEFHRHMNYHRSITSQAIDMVADDNQPILAPSSVQETIDNQLQVE